MKSWRSWKILNFLAFSVCLPRMHLSSGQFLLPWLLLLSPIIALDTTSLKIALGLPQRPLLISPTVPAQKSFWSRKALLFTGQGRVQYDRDAQCVWQSFPSMHSFDNVSLLFSLQWRLHISLQEMLLAGNEHLKFKIRTAINQRVYLIHVIGETECVQCVKYDMKCI